MAQEIETNPEFGFTRLGRITAYKVGSERLIKRFTPLGNGNYISGTVKGISAYMFNRASKSASAGGSKNDLLSPKGNLEDISIAHAVDGAEDYINATIQRYKQGRFPFTMLSMGGSRQRQDNRISS